MSAVGVVVAFALAAATYGAHAQGVVDGVTPAVVAPEIATPTSLAVRWPIVGDRNLNAAIAVSYRKRGDETWLDAYPLFRTWNDRVSPDNAVPGGHLFAGSIVDLQPDTEYEVRLALEDPDGGSATRTLTMRTAAVPRIPSDLKRIHVVPLGPSATAGGAGTQADPFRGLRIALQRAQPGQLLELAAGTYAEGTYVPPAGAPGRPLVIQGPADRAAVLDGNGGEVLIDLAGRTDVWIDRLALRNASIDIRADRAHRVSVTRNRFDVHRYGFRAATSVYRESTGLYVADNEFEGPSRWPRSKGIEDVNGVMVTGSGHVIAYNLFHNLGDGVHNGDEGRLSASDIHNNDFDACTDDAVEIDYSDTNVRVFRNRITNAYDGVSLQPVHGGPAYVFRNLMWNLQYSPFKLHNDTAGGLLFHNTSVKAGTPFDIEVSGETVRDIVTRNNLFVGTRAPALASSGRMTRDDFDNDGYDWGRGSFAQWNSRTYPSALAALGSDGLYAKLGAIPLGPQLTFDDGFGPPATYTGALDRARNRPLLAAASRAIDRGVRLPNFNDRSADRAPDLGCCERGEPLPWFGPRPEVLNAP